MDLASLSYYTSSDALSYVKISDQTGFNYELSFATHKTAQELRQILDIGLDLMTPQEKDLIKDKWITFSDNQSDIKKDSLFSNPKKFLLIIVLVIFVFFALGTSIFLTVFKKFKNVVYSKSTTRKNHLEEDLEGLEQAKQVIKEELSRIDLLEEDIKEQIDNNK